jgi:pimeloyl-ACP methyl ester carboxylesterase
MAFLLGLILLLAAIIGGLVWFSANTARRVEGLLPPRGQFMDIDGQRIHYTDTGGSKPPIVMIHGLGGNLLHFGYAMADKLAADYRVILVDRPGAGYSMRPEGTPATLTAQAKTIATLIRRLGLKQPLLAGHSLGGALSLAIALDHPDCAGALALIAPFTHATETVPEVFQGLVIASPLVRKAIALTVAVPLGIRRGPVVLKEVFAPEAAPADFPMRAGGLLSLRPVAFYNTSTDLMAAGETVTDYMARYKSLDIPMAMLFGRGDHVLDYRGQGEAMTVACPALDLELVEGGHMLPMTQADRCVALVKRVAERQQGMRAA